MRILIGNIGTRGDIEPFLALASELIHRKMQVTLACDRFHFALVRSCGIECIEIADTRRSDLLRKMAIIMKAPMEAREELWIRYFFTEKFQSLVRAIDSIRNDFDLIITGSLMASVFKSSKWKQHPMVLGLFSPFFSKSAVSYLGALAGGPENSLILLAASASLLMGETSFPASAVTTGFWKYRYKIRKRHHALDRFCQQGAPVIVITLGSSCGFNSLRLGQKLATQALRAGCKVVVQHGLARLGQGLLPSHEVLTLGNMPHCELFANASLVLHHGGAGTVASVLEAGKPSLVFPQWADQPLWARLLEAHGLSAGSIRDGTENSAFERIVSAVSDDQLREKCQVVCTRLRQENGAANAAKLIEEFGATML